MGSQSVISKLKQMLIVFLLVFVCTVTVSYATETEPGNENDQDSAEETNLPYMEMIVKSTKLESSKQITVDWWAYNVTKMQAFDLKFAYNSSYLQPSYISGENKNEVLENISAIKYDKRVDIVNEEKFDLASKNELLNSFSFDEQYKDILKVQIFRYDNSEYREINGKQTEFEKLQFFVSLNYEALFQGEELNGEVTTINPDEPIKIGTFSFRVSDDNPIIEEGTFFATRINITCDDQEDGFTTYTRDAEEDTEDCSEMIGFVYEKYGSISGTIKNVRMGREKNTLPYEYINIDNSSATIYVYNSEDVEDIDWEATGIMNYKKMRGEKIQPFLSTTCSEGSLNIAYIPNQNLTEEEKESLIPLAVPAYTIKSEDMGNFKIENILFGSYVILIDAPLYADYIITDITISEANRDINFNNTSIGTIQLEAGDINKDGCIDKTDRSAFQILYRASQKNKEDYNKEFYEQTKSIGFDLNFDGIIDKNDRSYMSAILTYYIPKKSTVIKKVVNFSKIEEQS